jgi:hypothetical protein
VGSLRSLGQIGSLGISHVLVGMRMHGMMKSF